MNASVLHPRKAALVKESPNRMPGSPLAACDLLATARMFAKKMLVVDDDRLIGWALQKGLSDKNLSIKVVETGRDALSEIKRDHFHLVLLDTHLPDVNGLELLGEIYKLSPDSRIIITSADVSECNKEKALSGGACQFLEKPFSIFAIQGMLRSALGDYSRRRGNDRYICDLPFHVELTGISPADAVHESGHHCGKILDVGKAGVRLSIGQRLAIGQKISLAHALEDSTFARFIPAGAKAEVVWVAPNDDGCTAGLKFQELSGYSG